MFRRKRSRGRFVIWCFILLLIGLGYGYFPNDTQTPNKPSDKIDEAKISETEENPEENIQNNAFQESTTDETLPDNTKLAIDNESIVTNNTKIIFKTYYERTRDIITKEGRLPVVLVGRSLEELQIYLKENFGGWVIRELNKDIVELYRTVDQISPNHFIVKGYNGYIAVFQIDESENMVLIDQTEIPLSSLSEVDLKKLEEGIIVKGRDGVNQILEDYSS